jgi:hypothetical protein
MRLTILAVLLLISPDAAADMTPRPMEEMKGDCTNYRWDVSRELALFESPADTVTASAAAPDAPPIAFGKRQTVTLVPHAEAIFDVAPEKDRGGRDKFSGHVRIAIPTPGLYRVVASNGVWIDAIAGGAIVKSAGFEMQTQCPTVFKVVAYEFSQVGDILLQLNGSKTPAVDIVVISAP